MDNALQLEARTLAEQIAARTQALFRQYGFSGPIRQSHPEIWSESVLYRNGEFEWEITVCLHPHDHPHSLSFQLSRNSGNTRHYASLPDFIQTLDPVSAALYREFLLSPEPVFRDSLARLHPCAEHLLQELMAGAPSIRFH